MASEYVENEELMMLMRWSVSVQGGFFQGVYVREGGLMSVPGFPDSSVRLYTHMGVETTHNGTLML